MHKFLEDGYLTTGDLSELTGWSRQYVSRDLTRRRSSLLEFLEACNHKHRRFSHHRFRISDLDGLLAFCGMVRELSRDSRGIPRYDIVVDLAERKRALKQQKELVRKWVRGRKIRFVSRDAALGWK